jgi:hypothetical protein
MTTLLELDLSKCRLRLSPDQLATMLRPLLHAKLTKYVCLLVEHCLQPFLEALLMCRLGCGRVQPEHLLLWWGCAAVAQ